MAKHMAEKEPLLVAAEFLKKLPGAAARLAQRKGLSEEDAMRELKKRAQAALENQASVKSSEKTRVIDDAKKWKAKTDNEATHKEAVNEAQAEKYPDSVVQGGQKNLQELISTYAEVGKEVPDFLKATDIQHSPEAAVFVSRVAQLPKDLQKNPEVLYKEAARLYWSMKWTEAAPEAVREVRGLLDRTFQEVRRLDPVTFGADTDERFLLGYDKRIDIYRTIRLDDVETAGDPPTKIVKDETKVAKGTKEYLAWLEKREVEVQHQQLERTLRTYQAQLDEPTSADLETQARLLDDFTKDLTQGLIRDISVDDPQYDVKYTIQKYNNAETQPHINRAREYRSKLETMIDIQKARERRDDLIKQGRVVEFTPEMRDRYRNHETPIGTTTEFRKLSKRSIDLIMSGPEGEEEWFSNFWNEIFNTGKEQAHPDLEESSEWSDAKNLLFLLYGDRAQHRIHTLSERWNSVGRFASLEKFLFYGKGDPKTKLEAIAQNKPKDMHWLHTAFMWSEYTESQYKRVMGDLMQTRTNEFLQAKKWLRAEITPQERQLLQVGAPDLLTELTEESRRTGKPVAHDSLLSGLQKRYATVDRATHDLSFGSLTPELDDLRVNLQIKRDLVGRGVYLLDSDMVSQSDLYQDMSYQQANYDAIYSKLANRELDELTQKNLIQSLLDARNDISDIDTRLRNPSLTQADRDSLVAQKSTRQQSYDSALGQFAAPTIDVIQRRELGNQLLTLDSQIRENWRKYTQNPFETRGPDSKELTALAGYSPVEIRVRDRVLVYLKKHGIQDPPEWRVREAIWAARQAQLGWGDAVDFAARTARAPVYDLMSSTTAKLGDPKGEDVMPAAYLEPIVRIINPDLFRDRFQMGGKAGDALYDIYYSIMFKKFGYKIEEDASSQWKKKLTDARKSGKPGWWRVYLDYAEDELNIPYSEILRPGFLHTGMELTNSTWRSHVAIIEPRRKEFMEMRLARKIPQDAPLDNVALGIQFAATNVKKDIPLRYKLLDKMVERTPSVFITQLGSDAYQILENHHIDPQGKEWRLFQDGLSNAEIKLWDNELVSTQRVNLAEQADFDRFVKPSLVAVGIPEQDTGKFRDVIMELQNKLREGAPGKTRLDKWAKHPFPLTVTTSDFNWKKTRSDLLGMYSNERRINDVLAMAGARDFQQKIFTTSELYSPVNFSDTFKELREFEKTVNMYDSTDTAEKATAPILGTLLEFNRNRAIHGPWGYIPGAVSLMKRLSEAEPEHIPILEWIPGWKEAIEEHGFAGKKWNEWPTTIGEAVSGSVRWTGREGNALDEIRLAGLLAEVREMGMFTNNPHLVGELERQFKTGFLWRALGTGRKYYWVVPLATIAVAVGHSIEEEKKKTSH